MLKLAENLKLKLDAATETFAILGRRGSGKTHTAVVMAEEMLDAGVQVVVIDPLDVWWGLRVSKDGKSAGIPIYVAGGTHQDIPLSADAGKVLADVVVDKGLSVVLSLRHLSKADQRRFVGDFGERLYDRKGEDKHRTALHVFIDEADAFVPQRLMPGSERCFGAIDTLVRRGRSSGIAPTLISQRPQVVNKDVLSQTEVLVAHQLTGPQDRKALEAWIEAHDTENQSAAFMTSLASLPKGTAWFWSPGMLDIFQKVAVRDRRTFDSSATPKPGAVTAKPRAFAEVDLEAITADIQATIEKAKADDPRELRKKVADLQQQLLTAQRVEHSSKQAPAPGPKVIEKPVITDAQIARAEGVLKRIEILGGRLTVLAGTIGDAIVKAGQPATAKSGSNYSAIIPSRTLAAAAEFGERFEAAGRVVSSPPKRPNSVNRPAAGSLSAGNASLPPGERATLTAALQYPNGLEKKRLGILTGYKRSSRDAYVARLAQKGLIEVAAGVLYPTESGSAALNGSFEPLPTGAELVDYWLTRLPEGERKVFQLLVSVNGGNLKRETIDERTEYKRSSRDAYLTRLKARGLVEFTGPGTVRASEELFS